MGWNTDKWSESLGLDSATRNEILEIARTIKDELVQIRQDLHSNPELGYSETKTSRKVRDFLTEAGIQVVHPVAQTGVVGLLGGADIPVFALRADMDALPIQERSELRYKSQVPNVMHACGHDAHTAILLGAAKILATLRRKLKGSVKFIFQPCEEQQPSGALAMVKAGVLDAPPVSAMVALHVDPAIDSGKVGIKYGVMHASVDEFTLEIKGKGGHAAYPQKAIDPIPIAAAVVQEIQRLVSRGIDPLCPVVITIGTIQGGTAKNVIADSVILTGTIRCLDAKERQEVSRFFKEQLGGIIAAYGGRAVVRYTEGDPVLVNNTQIVSSIREVAGGLLGDNNIVELERPFMGSEDFAYFLTVGQVPGAMFRLGIRNKDAGVTYPLHHEKFNVDDNVLWLGSAIMAGMAIYHLVNARRSSSHGYIHEEDHEGGVGMKGAK